MDYPYHSPTKAQLREQIRKQRRALPPARQAKLNQQLVANLLELIDDHSTDQIGALAFANGVELSLLAERKASLEEAFMGMTSHAVQYQASEGKN